MKVGIIGLPQSGRRTLFGLLTGGTVKAGNEGSDPIIGIAPVLDPRFDDLAARYRPRRETRARITVELLPALEESAVREGAVFRDVAGTDALCLVARDFEDERVYHVRGSVDAVRDIAAVSAELFLHDLIFIEKRTARIEEERKKGRDGRGRAEEQVLVRMREHLENDRPLRTLVLGDEERKIVSGYPLITMKEMVVVLNTGEPVAEGAGRASAIADRYAGQEIAVVTLSVKLETEIAELDDAGERDEFMKEAGIDEPALSLLTRTCMASLGLISFFTVGEDEVRQWMVRRGACAPEAAGVIHSDIQRGFIRAEVMKYDDLCRLGSEDAIKRAGKQHVMGRDYPVEDGDIISFRFNV